MRLDAEPPLRVGQTVFRWLATARANASAVSNFPPPGPFVPNRTAGWLERHAEGTVEGFERQVRARPEIVEYYGITGEADYRIEAVVPDMKVYDRCLHDVVIRTPGVERRPEFHGLSI